jgi:integrase
VVMVAAFAGLRASELRGLRWEDYTGAERRIVRFVWRTQVGPTKTPEGGEKSGSSNSSPARGPK